MEHYNYNLRTQEAKICGMHPCNKGLTKKPWFDKSATSNCCILLMSSVASNRQILKCTTKKKNKYQNSSDLFYTLCKKIKCKWYFCEMRNKKEILSVKCMVVILSILPLTILCKRSCYSDIVMTCTQVIMTHTITYQ